MLDFFQEIQKHIIFLLRILFLIKCFDVSYFEIYIFTLHIKQLQKVTEVLNAQTTFTYKYHSIAFFMSKNQVSVVYVFLTSYEMNQTHKNRSVQCTPIYSSPSFNNFQNFAMLISYSPTPFSLMYFKANPDVVLFY